ncbi:MAG: phosphopyruvate hydratase [Thermoplasmata archaeon]|nr:MAG: phosphopyruvate hydratase [Thermoplasmata archaeon]
MYISDIILREILDSRGNITVEAEVWTDDGVVGRASAPSGASRGEHEVVAFPKGDPALGIKFFMENVFDELVGLSVFDQDIVDAVLHEKDGTENFSNLGGNIAVAVSLAVARAAANTLGIPLYMYIGGKFVEGVPRPMGNVLGGGKHAIGGTDIQEYLAVALGPTMTDSIFANAKVHKKVGELLRKMLPGESIGKGDEGAWVAKVSNEEALEIVKQAVDEVSDEVGFPIRLSLDFAASELYKDGCYVYKDKKLDRDGQIAYVAELVDKYELYSVEDPLEQNDFDGYTELTKEIGHKCYVIGDDLFTTNYERLKKGIEAGAANGILIKPNQIGTLTDTIRTVKLARKHGYIYIISHRSGETTDNTIAHLAVGLEAPLIKTGAVGGERIAKLNELIRIEEELIGW